MLKKNSFIFFLLFTLLMTVSAFAEEPVIIKEIETEIGTGLVLEPQIREVDRIVAVVNEDVITRTELDDVIAATIGQLRGQGVQPPDDETMQSQILESIITKRIQLQRAQEIGLSVSESELDETILRVAQENKLSLQEFYQALEADNIEFSRFRNDIRDEIVMVRLREREVNNQVNITEGEIDNYLRTMETSAVGGDEYLIAHILLTVSEQVDVLQNA
ncbi:MAG: SurA N-terminal domain-containing protein, partial [Nitrosomonas sp.]|nr:SurA N-terminal domain-containing protein [Nitrosomonas sp.]